MATSVYEDLSAEIPQRREHVFFPVGESDTLFTGEEKGVTGDNEPEKGKRNVYPDNGLSPTPYNTGGAEREKPRFTGEVKNGEQFSTGTANDRSSFPAYGHAGEGSAKESERETDFSGLRAMARLYGDLAGFSKREEDSAPLPDGDPLSERFRRRINRSTEPEALQRRIRAIRRNGWSPYATTRQKPSLYEGTEKGKPSLYE